MSLEDAAQEHEAKMWELNNRPRATPPPSYGPAQCVECDADMPEIRRQHGFTRCVACQAAIEQVPPMRRR